MTERRELGIEPVRESVDVHFGFPGATRERGVTGRPGAGSTDSTAIGAVLTADQVRIGEKMISRTVRLVSALITPVKNRVPVVLGSRSVCQIDKPIVCGIAVQVTDDQTSGARTQKCGCNQYVDSESVAHATTAEHASPVSDLSDRSFQNPFVDPVSRSGGARVPAPDRTDASIAGNLVLVFPPVDRKPPFPFDGRAFQHLNMHSYSLSRLVRRYA